MGRIFKLIVGNLAVLLLFVLVLKAATAAICDLQPDWTVHNHGESGFYSRQELGRLLHVGNLGEPVDLVVFYDGYSTLHQSKLERGVDHRMVYPRIQAAIRDENADWIHELTDAFDGDELVYMGPSHVTENGNETMARRISEIVGPLLEARVRSRESDAALRSGSQQSG
jgi:hypothetical protein